MKRFLTFLSLACLALACGPKDGVYTLHLLTTNDIHGSYFDSTYVGGGVRRSMFTIKYYADSVRAAAGKDNVLLLDAGDFLQGDNAAYYFNYVDTASPHVFPRLAEYLGYDASFWTVVSINAAGVATFFVATKAFFLQRRLSDSVR